MSLLKQDTKEQLDSALKETESQAKEFEKEILKKMKKNKEDLTPSERIKVATDVMRMLNKGK